MSARFVEMCCRRMEMAIKCPKCIFRANKFAPYTCDYASITGKTRGAMPAEQCIHFASGERIEERTDIVVSEKSPPLKDKKEKTVIQTERKERKSSWKFDWDMAKRLYDAGMNDHEIGKEIGASASTVMSWRKRRKLRANAVAGWKAVNERKREEHKK